MEHLRIMSARTKYLNIALRLASVTLITSLAGCSLNPFSNNDDPQNAVRDDSMTRYQRDSSTNPAPVSYEPVLERINEPVPLAEGHPNDYVVQVDDTLWDIAATFLRDPWFWPEIWYVNPEIENPHLIYPGDLLSLIYIDNQPRITNTRASIPSSSPTFRLSPQARSTPLSEAVSSIRYESVAAFLTSGVVLDKRQAKKLPYLLQTRGEHLMASAGNEVYVRGIEDDQPGTRYTVINVGEALRDPDNNRLIGYQGNIIGQAQMRRGGDPATIALISSTREANVGDRLLPATVDMPLNFFPRAPSSEIDGRIIHVVDGVSQIGQYQVVVMNRGLKHGLSVGDVLSVFQTGDTIWDPVRIGRVKLPDEEEGTVMVFKTFERMSYGLVMEATNAIHLMDAVRNPS
jgi:hypothetical protein